MTGTGAPRPVTPAAILAEQLLAASRLAAGLDPYLSRWSTPESEALQDLAGRTRAHDWSAVGAGRGLHLEQEMLSGHVEGQFLKLLVFATRARQVLEVGMFTGYSALAMAEALPAGGRVVACEIDPDVAAFAQECFAASKAGARVDVRVGPALDTLAGLDAAGEVFDLVFVDADKAGYEAYLDALLTGGLLGPHALVCVDNTLMQGQPWMPGEPSPNGSAIHAFNRAVAADPRVEQVILPLRDGITLIRRRDVS